MSLDPDSGESEIRSDERDLFYWTVQFVMRGTGRPPRTSSALRAIVHADFNGRCAYCRRPESLVGVTFHLDHIMPVSSGGPSERDNLALACGTCNDHKSNRIRGRDPVTGRRVRLFNPRTQTWTRHFRWSEDGRFIEGRTSTGRATVVIIQLNEPLLVEWRAAWIRMGVIPPHWGLPDDLND